MAAASIADKGDANNDGVVNILDFNIVVSCFGKKVTTSFCSNRQTADINKDGIIDGTDYTIVLKYFGDTVPLTPTPTVSLDSDLQSIDSSLNQLDSDLKTTDQDLSAQ